MAKYDEDSEEMIEEKNKVTKRSREEFKKEIVEDQSEQISAESIKKYFYECKKFPKDFLQTKADESNSNKIIFIFASEGGSCDHPLFLATQKIWRKPLEKYEKYFKHEQISSLGLHFHSLPLFFPLYSFFLPSFTPATSRSPLFLSPFNFLSFHTFIPPPKRFSIST